MEKVEEAQSSKLKGQRLEKGDVHFTFELSPLSLKD
jgi:hypothetical protein